MDTVERRLILKLWAACDPPEIPLFLKLVPDAQAELGDRVKGMEPGDVFPPPKQ